MAEVTKVCPGCDGQGRVYRSTDGAPGVWLTCLCSGTGRVPFDAAKEWARFTPEQRIAMALAAPKVARGWVEIGVGGWFGRLRPDGSNVIDVVQRTHLARKYWFWRRQRFESLDAAKRAADEWLVDQGWLLENGIWEVEP